MTPPAAVLDIDGTLVDSNYLHVVSWHEAFRQFGIELPFWRIHRAIGMGGDQPPTRWISCASSWRRGTP